MRMRRFLLAVAAVLLGAALVSGQQPSEDELADIPYGSSSDIPFGSDSGGLANDGVCDDPRFIGDRGEGAWPGDALVNRDATDCRTRLRDGLIRWPDAEERRERFQLYTGCLPLELAVLVAGRRAAEIGLTRERLQTLGESRLRAARLFRQRAPSALVLRVSTLGAGGGSAFSVAVQLWKPVQDRNGYSFRAPTWRGGAVGQGGDAGFILQGVSEYVDEFILEYLRVNEADC